MEALLRVVRLHLEPDLDVVVRVRANDKVDIVPVSEQSPLNVCNRLRQMLSVLLPQLLVPMTGNEVAIELLAVLDPLRAQNFEVVRFIRIILHQVTDSRGLNIVCVVLGLEIFTMED
jgi:hypothetical protein